MGQAFDSTSSYAVLAVRKQSQFALSAGEVLIIVKIQDQLSQSTSQAGRIRLYKTE